MVLVGKVTFVGDDDIFYDDADAFLDCIREELPYVMKNISGIRYGRRHIKLLRSLERML